MDGMGIWGNDVGGCPRDFLLLIFGVGGRSKHITTILPFRWWAPVGMLYYYSD